MMESQSNLDIDNMENILHSIMQESNAYLIIKNGIFDFELSNIPNGVNVFQECSGKDSFADILANEFEFVTKYNQNNSLLIECDSSLSLVEPLYILFIDKNPAAQQKSYSNFYLIREGAQVTIVEKQIADLKTTKKQELNIFSNWFLENNATLTYYSHESNNKRPDCSINNNIMIRQMGNSSASFFWFYWEDGITNNDIEVSLDGEFAACNLYSASLLLNSTVVNHNIRMNHNSANCESSQVYKGVFNDNSSSNFNSLIYVNKRAQKTSSIQQNNNIILSDYASVKSNPQLEIFADDVKCAHGSTIGQIDPKALFYLQSRGIGKELGTAMLLRGFLSDVIDEVVDLKLKDLVLNKFYKLLKVNH